MRVFSLEQRPTSRDAAEGNQLDTPSQESTGTLNIHQAAALFDGGAEPEKEQPTDAAKPAEVAAEPAKAEADLTDEKPAEEAAAADEGSKVTIEVDGKTIELTAEQIAEAYKSGLRQSDYTQKTMAVAEQRKAADAEAAKVREERQQLAVGLQHAQAMLQAQLHEQSQIDWQKLIDTDPQEYLKQRHLADTRQAKLQGVMQEQQQLHAKTQAEQVEQKQAFIRTQQDELLAKLPEWKDEAKAKTEKAALKEYLKEQGFDDEAIGGISDHRAVLLSRKAMLYDQMMSKAKAAAKKVSALPQKVERPGGGETNSLDGRTAAMKRLGQSGSIRDAARVFETLL